MAEHDILDQLRNSLERESSDSVRLMENIKDNPICSISIDQSVPCIAVAWKQYATSTQLRFVHESILLLLQMHHLNKILADVTALPNIHEEDQAWIINDWMPRAIAAGLQAAAGKRSSSYFGKLSVDNIQSNVADDLAIQSFDDLSEARQWLKNVDLQQGTKVAAHR
jgi:hypothetical protein